MSSINSLWKAFSGGGCKRTIQLLTVTFGVLLLCLPAFSQGNLGRIMGTVTDQSGGVVAGATVTVLDVARGISRTLTTDDAGEYNAPNLTPGGFTVRVEAKGFKKIERQNVDVGVGKEIRVDLTLQPGEQEQTVTVTEAVPLVETTNATLGGTLDNADIVDMPLNGRNYQLLLGLRPGVMVQPGGGPWTQSTNGVRPDESVWMVDGVINSNFMDARPILGMPSPITDGATILPVDAIQEFNTMENPKAEYGWKPGAVVNVGIKSGTNQIHGSAYAFGRDGSWGARNAYNIAPLAGGCPLSSCDKLPVQLKQFGGVVGGPIIKDKLFFFGGYEGLRSFIGQALATSGAGVPGTATEGDPKLSFVDAINCLQFATDCGSRGVPTGPIAVSPVTLKLTGCTVGATAAATACTGGFFPNVGAANGYLSTFPNSNTSNNGIGKIDFHPNDKNSISGLLAISKYSAVGEDHAYINPIFLNTFPITTWTDTENWIYTPSSTTVNEVRFGYDRMTISQASLDAGVADPINTGLTAAAGFPNIAIKGFNSFGTQHNRPQTSGPNPYYDFQESISYLKGKHSFKFGGEYTHLEADSLIPDTGRGKFSFNGGKASSLNPAFTCPAGVTSCPSTPLEDFLSGDLTNGVALVGNAKRTMHWSESAVFAQDDWRVTPKLTVNWGLRYSYESPIREANNQWANFDPNSPTGLVQQGASSAATMWHPDTKDLSPRVGFAWDVTGKGTTVVRGGFSIMYSTFTAVMWMNQNTFQNSTAVSIAANPTGALLQTGGCSITAPVSCPTAGGNIQLGSATFSANAMCWDPALASSCATGGPTAFPSGGQIACGDGLPGDAAPCNLLAVDPNLKTPYVENFNFGIQHQFGTNWSLEVGYVGNHGARLTGFADINQAPAGAGYCLNSLTAAQKADACKGFVAPVSIGDYQALVGGGISSQAAQEARPLFSKFPYIGFINQMTNNTRSNYNSLQATLTKRLSHGLSFIAGYTYAHGLDSGSLNRFGMLPQFGTADQYADGDFDVRHRFTLTATYNIPGIKGYGQVLEGWQINAIANLQSSQPWRINDGGNDFNGTNDNSDLWDFSGNRSSFKSGFNTIPYCTAGDLAGTGASCVVTSTITTLNDAPLGNSSALWQDCVGQATTLAKQATLLQAGCYASANGSGVMTPNGLGQFGSMGRNIFRDSGFRSFDFSVFKNFTFKERYGVQFRAEFFNILNHPIAANPYGASSNFNSNNDPSAVGTFGGAGGTPDVIAGNNVVGSGANRDIQLGLKLSF